MFKYFLYRLQEEAIPLGAPPQGVAFPGVSHAAVRAARPQITFSWGRRDSPAGAAQAGGCPGFQGSLGHSQRQRRLGASSTLGSGGLPTAGGPCVCGGPPRAPGPLRLLPSPLCCLRRSLAAARPRLGCACCRGPGVRGCPGGVLRRAVKDACLPAAPVLPPIPALGSLSRQLVLRTPRARGKHAPSFVWAAAVPVTAQAVPQQKPWEPTCAFRL